MANQLTIEQQEKVSAGLLPVLKEWQVVETFDKRLSQCNCLDSGESKGSRQQDEIPISQSKWEKCDEDNDCSRTLPAQ